MPTSEPWRRLIPLWYRRYHVTLAKACTAHRRVCLTAPSMGCNLASLKWDLALKRPVFPAGWPSIITPCDGYRSRPRRVGGM